ncbi:TetR/AcrR family transcriptional regulator [Streptomyces sp. SID3343]|uniref:TetR/AcrR family transcriptional regulator n=1 Tax=Streptomyces sp. SID3343 TaxID=2690260 RepID=UPI0013685BF7|nr:TetR/AcrR family transcriptional regulator [Streptomyces sp. SID3343]MYW00548.1 TetR family transcriptional regulator [Streptomyces sp. SID3343]
MAGEPVSVWTRPERGRRGPAPGRSRAQITATAVELADADGLAAVSMRQVARRLDTGPASLYRYVAAREDLIDLMADAVTAEIDLTVTPSGDWTNDLVALAAQAKAVYLRHPWLLDVMAQYTPLGPASIDYLEHALTLLDPAPASSRAKLEAIGILGGLVTLFARNELNARSAGASPDERQRAQTAYLGEVAAAGKHPRLLAAMTSAAGAAAAAADASAGVDTGGGGGGGGAKDADSWGDGVFERTLRRVLAGLLAPGE